MFVFTVGTVELVCVILSCVKIFNAVMTDVERQIEGWKRNLNSGVYSLFIVGNAR